MKIRKIKQKLKSLRPVHWMFSYWHRGDGESEWSYYSEHKQGIRMPIFRIDNGDTPRRYMSLTIECGRKPPKPFDWGTWSIIKNG